jgi:hypothetical protein
MLMLPLYLLLIFAAAYAAAFDAAAMPFSSMPCRLLRFIFAAVCR